MSKLRKENHQLKMKLNFETKSNFLLCKNLNRIRTNYFNHAIIAQ